MQLHFVLFPETKVRKKTADFAKKLAAVYDPIFVVDNSKLIPHITLFSNTINKKDYKKLEVELGLWLKTENKIHLFFEGFLLWFPDAWVGLAIKNNKSLNLIRNRLADFVTGYSSNFKIKSAYYPHITLIKIKNSRSKSFPFQAKEVILNQFVANSLGVCLVGKHSQIHKNKIIKEFKLQ